MKKMLSVIIMMSLTAPALYAAHTMVVMKTSAGDVTIELFDDRAPATVSNFLRYVDEGFYDGTIFHRVIDNFIV